MKIQLKFTVILMLALSVAFTSCGGEGSGDAAGNLPVVTTAEIAGNPVFTVDIAGTSAKGGGDVTEQGDSEVTDRGICWNTTGNPTISDNRAADGTGIGEFTNASMTGLTVNTTYYVRAYATNGEGTSYGNEITFNSGRTFGTDYAGGLCFL